MCGSRGKAVQTMKSRKHKNLPAFSRTDKENKKIGQLIGEKRTFFDGLTPRFFFLMRPSLNEIWIDLMGWYDQKVSAPSLGRWETKREGKVHPINKRRTSNPKKFWAVGSVSLIKLSFIRRNKHTSFVFQTVDSMNFFNFVSCWTKYVTQKKSSFFFLLEMEMNKGMWNKTKCRWKRKRTAHRRKFEGCYGNTGSKLKW